MVDATVLRLDRNTNVLTLDDLLLFQRLVLRQRGDLHQPCECFCGSRVASANHGRWIVECDCGTWVYVLCSDRAAACTECGRFHRNVILPGNIDAINRVLDERIKHFSLIEGSDVDHARHSHWLPGESVDDLVAENVEHGVTRVS